MTGNITSYQFIDNFGHSYTLSNFSFPFSQFDAYSDLNSFVADIMAGDDNIVGTAASEVILGYAGNDTLDGGAGADTLAGGMGNDTYIVDNIGDIVTENMDEGIDLVKVKIATAGGNYTLTNAIENATLINIVAYNLTGNELDNLITGNVAANILNGGLGADTMNGGKGNDIYIVDDPGDTVTESLTIAQGGGIDTVKSSITFTLDTNVDRLTLTGTNNIDGTGNDINNIIIGNAGNNYLTGNAGIDTLTGNDGNDTLDGGLGNDTMNGGKGDDLYIVDSITDVVTESLTFALGGGIDTVQSSVTRTLGANFDNLTLTGSVAINGTGNALDNVITGNDVDNTLKGLGGNDTIDGGTGHDILVGGLGNDLLTGGDGNDIFRFESTLNAMSNLDTITDFISLDDVLELENSIFMKLTITGALSANNFRSAEGVAAQDVNDYILYDNANGALYYDADGNGAGAAIHFATLVGLPDINASDIWIT